MKDYDKNKEPLYIQYSDVNNLYGWAMSQKLPLNNFESIKDTPYFNEDFIKNTMKKVILKLMINILKNYMNLIYHFYLKEWKLKKSKNLLEVYMIKINMLYTQET